MIFVVEEDTDITAPHNGATILSLYNNTRLFSLYSASS